MDDDVKAALHSFKKAKKLVDIERQRVIAMLPDDVADELHFNGPYRAAERYPEYATVFNEFKD